MRWATVAAALASTPLGLCFEQQQWPLSNAIHPGSRSSSGSRHAQVDAPPYRDELIHLHKSLVSIPSHSGKENEVGSFLVDYLTTKGYQVDIQFVPPPKDHPDVAERFNVVAWRGSKKRSHHKVLVTSHIDVVPPHIPWEIERGDVTKETMIKGRGSVDAKGSVAAQIVAVNHLLDTNEHVNGDDLMLLFVVGEETTGDGMRFFSDSLEHMAPRPTFESAIFGEPTENRLACGHKGGLFCDLWAKGKDGHSGYPELGKSANELMVRAMAKVLDADLGSSKRFGNTTVNIGRFDGGVAANVIPAHAYVSLAARLAAGAETDGHEAVMRKIQDILDETDKEAFTFECTHGYGPYVCNCDVDSFEPIIVNYGTDIPNLSGDHVRYLYGPGSILVAHGDHENLTVGDLETAVDGYLRLILHALKQ